MTRIFTILSLALVCTVFSNANHALAQPGSQNGIGQRFVWKNVYIVEKRSTATEWVYQIRVNGTWTTVATASTRDMLFSQVIFMANHDQLPEGPSRNFERLRNPNWQFDSEHNNQESARNRRNQIASSSWNARIRTVMRSKTREELMQVPKDYKIVVPRKPQHQPRPGINGPSIPNSGQKKLSRLGSFRRVPQARQLQQATPRSR